MAHQETGDLDRIGLQRSAAECRRLLAHDPSDLAARISLSWYLLFESLLTRQRDELWARLLAPAAGLDDRARAALLAMQAEEAVAARDHRGMLKESLQHAATAMQLSVHCQERSEAARIRELAELIGAGHVVSETDEEAELILARVARAVCTDSREDLHP